MTLVERGTVTRCAVGLLLVAMVPGCETKPGGDTPDTSGTATSSSGPSGTTTRAQLLAEATTNYRYGSPREPVKVDTSRVNQPGGKLPGITIQTATRLSATGRRGSNRFLARLYVIGGAYTQMGLAPGVNYVWRDSAGPSSVGWLPARGPVGLGRISFLAGIANDPTRMLIVPEDPTHPMRWLQQDANHTALSAGSSEMPRLVMSTLGYGVCDNSCTGGHCVAVQATPGTVTDPVPTTIGP